MSPTLPMTITRSTGRSFIRTVKTCWTFHRLTASGSLGQPGAATAEKGASLLEAVVADVVAFLRDFARWPDLAP